MEGESWSYGDLLHANEIEGLDVIIRIFQAKLNGFLYSRHKLIKGFGLGMTAPETRHRGNVIALYISLNDNAEFLHRYILLVQTNRHIQLHIRSMELPSPCLQEIVFLFHRSLPVLLNLALRQKIRNAVSDVNSLSAGQTLENQSPDGNTEIALGGHHPPLVDEQRHPQGGQHAGA